MEQRGSAGAARRLELPADVRERVRAWARAAYPAEGCGLLIGREFARGAQVVRATLARNLRSGERHDRYEVDPADHLAAWKAAEREGLAVVGAWHSHPDGQAVPSATDCAEASGGLSYLIVAVGAASPGELRSWRLASGGEPNARTWVEELLAV